MTGPLYDEYLRDQQKGQGKQKSAYDQYLEERTGESAPFQSPTYQPLDDTTIQRIGREQREVDAPPDTRPPAPRRGIGRRLADWWTSATSVTPPSPATLNPIASAANRPQPTPMELPTDHRTAEQRAIAQAADEAEQRRQEATSIIKRAAAADVTGTPGTTLVPGPLHGTSVTLSQFETTKARHEREARGVELRESTPEHWQQAAAAMRELAARLRTEGRVDDAADAERQARNAERLAAAKGVTETKLGAAVSSFLSPIADPLKGERENILTAGEPGIVPSREEQIGLGQQPALPETRPDMTRDLVVPLAAQLPWFAAGEGLLRTGLGAAGAAIGSRAPRIGAALEKAAAAGSVGEKLGPAIPVTGGLAKARIAEEMASLAQVIPRGLTMGQTTAAALTYRAAREQGATPEQALTAVAEGVAVNAAIGVGAEAAIGIAGRIAGLTYDPIGRVFVDPTISGIKRKLSDVREGLDARMRQVDRAERTMTVPNTEETAQSLPDPTNPTPSRAQRLADRLRTFASRRPEEIPPLVEGIPERGETPVFPAVRETREPIDEVNAVTKMADQQRQQAELEQRIANDPTIRSEVEAQMEPERKQGPLTLEQTIARAKREAEQGEPLATEYRDAINGYVDALVAVRDTPAEKEPTTKAQVALARARSALNDARQRYGAQFGASAVLALAANSDDLTDEEKGLVGLGGLAILGTDIVKSEEPVRGSRGLISRLKGSIEALPKAFDQARPASEWIGKLKSTQTHSKAELQTILPELEAAAAEKRKLTRADVLEIANKSVPEIERVTYAEQHAASGVTRGEHGEIIGNPDMIDDVDVVVRRSEQWGALGRADIDEQVAHRRARIAEIEAEIESQIDSAREEMESRQEHVTSEASAFRDLANRHGLPDADAFLRDVDEHLEGDYMPPREWERIRSELIDAAYENIDARPEYGSDAIDFLEGNDYEFQETEVPAEPKKVIRTWRIGENGEREEHEWPVSENRPLSDHLDAMAGRGDFERSQTVYSRNAGQYIPTGEDLAANAEVVEVPQTRTEYRVLHDGEDVTPETGKPWTDQDDLAEAILNRDYADAFSGDHDTVEELVRYLDDYKDAYISYNEAESTHYSMDEDRDAHFHRETQEIEDLEGDISLLEQHAESLPEMPEPTADEQAALPAPAAEEIIQPPIARAPTSYARVQMISGARNFRELFAVWKNKPGRAYAQSHYFNSAGIENLVVHARTFEHDMPTYSIEGGADILDRLHEFAQTADKGDVILDRLDAIRDVRRQRDEALKRMADLEAQYNALPADARDPNLPAVRDMTYQLKDLYDQVVMHGRREDQLLLDLEQRAPQIIGPKVQVYGVGEVQSDWSQDAARQGIERPRDPDADRKIAELRDRHRVLTDRLTELGDIADAAQARISNEFWQPWNDLILETTRYDHDLVERFRAAMEAHNAQPDAPYAYTNLRSVSLYEMTAETGLAEANWLREHGTPEIKELIAKIDEALGPAKTAVDERRAARAEDAAVLGQMQDLEEGSRGSVPQTPFIQGGDKKEGDRFNVNGEATYALGWALPILDASERGFEHFVWSDADNRMKNASLPRGAGKLVYDRWAAQQIRKLLKFAKIDLPADAIKHVYIRGEGHWYLHLTREMRDAIKRYGLPILGIMALTPSDSKAQPAEGEAHVPETPHLMYLTAVGGVAAGMALAALAHSKRLRRLVRENADLRRELMLDDLSGVSNRKAFSLAKSVVDNDDAVSWVVADGNRFKMLNDKHGHPAGDKAIQHFGKQIIRVAEELDVSPRAFRIGGDEFAVAIPKDKAAEFRTKLEEASSYSVGAGDEKVTTSLTGAVGNTFDEADALLGAFKSAAREADPTLGREAHLSPVRKKIEGMENGATFYANPIPQALREVMRYPSAVALAGVATALNSSDDPDLQATAKPVYALAVLNAIGSRRLIAGKDKLVSSLLGKLARTEEGLKAVRALNPEALLSPDVKSAIQQYERERSRAKAKAAETSRAAKQLGPKGDRAVSDVLENEQWEDVSQMAPDELKATLAIATKIDNEYQQSATELLQTGARQPGELLENYAGPRRYAYYEAQHAQTEGRPGAGGGRTPRISATKSRTLDIPIRNAEDALARAQASGDPSRIQDAQDALTEARLVQMSKRTELGEIREASYRAAQGIERAYADAAAARLFVNLRDLDGVVHPEWNQAMTDLDAAKAAKSAAATPADKQAAQTLIDEAKVRLHELTRQYQRRGEAYVALPDVRSLGKLRGAIVNRDVYNSLVGFTDREGWYGQLLRRWKEIKTVFNPGTHQGNIFSNIGFAHMEGLNLWEQPMYLKRAAADMKSYGPATKALAEAGILDVNAVTADEQGIALRDVARREGLEELSKTTRPETADVLRREGISGETQRRRRRRTLVRGAVAGAALGGAKMASDEEPEGMALGVVAGAAIGAGLGAIREQVRRTYNNEDNIFRAAIWLKKVESGMRPEDATAYTRNALGNFRSRSPALQVLRSTISPFVLYPAKALPRLGQQIIDHPWRYLTLISIWGGLNEYSQRQVGDVEDRDLPVGQRNRLGYFFPGFTQLPFENEKGERGGVDVSRWTPLSALTTAAPPGSVPASFSERAPDILRAGGPVVDLAARFGANVDPYTGSPAYARDYPPSQNISSLLQDVAGTMLPSALDFHAERIKEDIANADWDKFKNDLLGPTGLRPRFIRPGANVVNASYQLDNSLREMKQDFRRSLRYNKNPDRIETLRRRYMARVHQAITNFTERTGQPPPPETLDSANPDTPLDEERRNTGTEKIRRP